MEIRSWKSDRGKKAGKTKDRDFESGIFITGLWEDDGDNKKMEKIKKRC